MKYRASVQNRLRRARRERADLTQQQLAERVGVSRQTIVSIERGRYNPTVGLALALAGALGLTVEDLFQLGPGDAEGEPPGREGRAGARTERDLP
jgi:putative transcriptional regulator